MNLFELKEVNFKSIIKYPHIQIPKNKVIFLTGKSGCGKSTMLKLLNGIITADSGSITYLNIDIENYDSIELRKNAMLCSQSFYLWDLSIRDNFKQFHEARESDVPTDVEIKKYLDICQADFDIDTVCTTMSGGERQRVFMAICLSFKPKVLMLDEPTSALDEATATAFFTDLIPHCKASNTDIICISHDKTLTDKFAEHIIILESEVGGRS